MKTFKHKTEAVAIFLTSEQIKYLNNFKDKNYVIDLFLSKIKSILPNLPIHSNYKFENLDYNFIQTDSEIIFLKEVSLKLPNSISGEVDIDEVFFAFFQGIFPLLSKKFSIEIIEKHIKYLSQYSYSENLPNGIVPNLLSREFVQLIPSDLKTTSHEYLLKNINHFDVEIFYKEPDLRQYRFDFSLSNKNSIELTHSILKLNEDIEFEEIFPLIENNPNLFRSNPAYLELEIYRGCDNKCSFCPRQYQTISNDFSFMPKELISKMINDLKNEFNFPLTVCFGGLGEPLLHPDFEIIAKNFLELDNTKELIIETSLYPDINIWKKYFENLKFYKNKISIIVNLTTLNSNKYKSIYVHSNLEDTLEKINSIADILGKDRVHVQMIKMKEVEDEIENYFNHFEKMEINVILQKYNRYIDLMPEKRVSDLTPIHRNFCWHLARDFYVQVDGSVSLCKQKEKLMGNLNSNTISEIWQTGMEDFKNSFLQKHKNVNAPCLNCDEWYTFNA